MTIHLLKIAAGIKNIQELQDVQKNERTIMDSKRGPVIIHPTRNTPTKMAQILDGGSLYWIIKGAIQLRQPIIDIERVQTPDGSPLCYIYLSPTLIRVTPVPHRPIQGWRYMDAERAPKDICIITENDDIVIDDEMMNDLREMGLL